jgi:hypothetical protein
MRSPAGFVVPLVLLTAACSSSSKAPVLPSSSGQTAYAIRYSEELAGATKAITEAQQREKTLSGGFAAHVDQLKKPDWQKVEVVIDDSDEAGKSADFAEAQGEATAIKGFWDSDKNELSSRVSGNMQHAMKESGCNADVGGSVSFALNDAITKQLQKRLRARNEAFVVLERYKTTLGPQNVAPLEKLADEVSEASYDVHVQMVLQRNRLQRLVADKDDVKKTLDRYVQEETAFQAEAGRSEPEKKASSDRVNTANKNKAEVDTVAAQAESMSKEMDKSIDAATKDYEEALKNLKTKVAEKKKAEPSKGDGPAKAEPPKPSAPKSEPPTKS